MENAKEKSEGINGQKFRCHAVKSGTGILIIKTYHQNSFKFIF